MGGPLRYTAAPDEPDGETFTVQQAGGNRRAIAAGANRPEFRSFGQLTEMRGKIAQKKMSALFRDVPLVPLSSLPDIKNLQRLPR